jgi:hypothetical protein
MLGNSFCQSLVLKVSVINLKDLGHGYHQHLRGDSLGRL